MARPRDEAKRSELLDGVVRYIAAEGLSELSLRLLAERLGTSARMLLHYFGSKEQMLIDALTALRPDARQEFSAGAGSRLAATEESRISLGALMQVLAAATVPGSLFADYGCEAIRNPIADVAGVLCERYPLGSDDATEVATLLVSGLRGLVLDLLITGDTQRVNAAADRLIASVLPDAIVPNPQTRKDCQK